jgi:hypothetical protein
MTGVGFPAGTNTAQVVATAQNALTALRSALVECHNIRAWLAAYASADLVAAPVSLDSASANAILSAFADADALYQLYMTGALASPPSGYTTPGTYVFGASQRVVIGPIS